MQSDPQLHRTMLLRAILAHAMYQKKVKTIVLALSPQAVVPTDYVYGEGPDGEALRHRVTVRRVFAESADAALASDIAELLPLIPAMQPQDGNHAKAESLLTILDARGVEVSKALRHKILSCTDAALLDRWLRKAASATSAADVLRVP